MKKTKDDARSLNDKALKALKEAVSETIRDHAKTGDPIVIYKNGKVIRVKPSPRTGSAG